MKVLFVIKKISGGVGRYVKEVSNSMKLLGWEVETISREEDVKTGFFGSFTKLRSFVSKRNYDFLVSNDWSIALPLLGLRNHFCVFHGHSPKIPGKILQEIAYYLLANRVIVVGDFLKELYPKTNLVYEGVSLSNFKPSRKKAGKRKRVGFVQNREDETYRYGIIENAVKKMGLEMVVAEKIPHEKMSEFYNSIDVFISIPDSRTGFNLCWLEAMACNVPTIGNDNGIGKKLPITKVSEPPTEDKIIEAIKASMKRGKVDYRSWIKKNGMTWEECARKIIESFESRTSK
jgi:glycosyltransferase involved in cell wall biosynthesis